MARKGINKSFDCLAFKDRVQAEIYEEIKDLSPAEEVEYFRKAAQEGPLGEWWKRVNEKTKERKKARWSERPRRDEQTE
jgi:hypothetical protein